MDILPVVVKCLLVFCVYKRVNTEKAMAKSVSDHKVSDIVEPLGNCSP